MRRRGLIRNLEAGEHLDLFMVAAVTSILVIRLYLEVTGYPQLGGTSLHIAHMLWGGLFMLVAIIMTLSFLGRAAERLAAVIGGVGFGTFIDEVGKFVTHDNDYFFRPSLAIIYVIFVLTYLLIRWIQNRRVSEMEYLVNALRGLEEVAKGDLDHRERDRVLEYLKKCDATDPMVVGMRRVYSQADVIPTPLPNRLVRLKSGAFEWYRRVSHLRGFTLAVVIFFVAQLVVLIGHVAGVVFLDHSWVQVLTGEEQLDSLSGQVGGSKGFLGAEFGFSLVSACFVSLGVWHMRRSRMTAYEMFQRSILVTILLTEPLMFYRDQWSALIGLTFNILVFLALRFMIEREQAETRRLEPAMD